MNGKSFRRVSTVAAALAVSGLALTACSGASSGPAELSDEPVTLRVTWWGGDARAKLTQEAIDAFEDKYPNITVEPQYSEWTGYWDQLATATAANDSADVLQMDESYLASYGARGALYDLSQAGLDLSKLPEELVTTGQIDGAQYAAPIGIGVYAMVANADLFTKYGIELPDDENWTWEDYADLANEITKKSGGEIHGTAQVGGFDIGSVRYWGRSAGNEVFDGNDVTLKPEVLADMWQYELDLIASGGMESAPAIIESQAAGLAGSSLATGKVALGLTNNTQLAALTAAGGADLRLLKLPEPDGISPNFYKPSMFWSASSQSKHPAEAALFIDFLINHEEAANIIKTERGVPANNDMRALIEPSLSDVDKAAIAYQERVTPGKAFLTPNGASGMEGIFARYSQQVLSGQAQPLDAAKSAVEELQREITAAN